MYKVIVHLKLTKCHWMNLGNTRFVEAPHLQIGSRVLVNGLNTRVTLGGPTIKLCLAAIELFIQSLKPSKNPVGVAVLVFHHMGW